MARFTVVLDACVLYPAPLRDLFMELAVRDMFSAKWTERIHDEWVAAVLRKRPELADKLIRTRQLMDSNVRDCLVTNYESLIDSVVLPDSKDRHVVAAAIRCGADMIVTKNLKHFPVDELSKYDLEAQHPDEFLINQFGLSQPIFIAAVRQCRVRLRKPPKSVDEYLGILLTQELPRTVSILREYAESI
jgi:hypothetical protein